MSAWYGYRLYSPSYAKILRAYSTINCAQRNGFHIPSAGRLSIFRVFKRFCDELPKQRVRPARPRLELRVKLRPYKPGVIRELQYLDEAALGAYPGEPQTVFGEDAGIRVIELVTVAMPLMHKVSP